MKPAKIAGCFLAIVTIAFLGCTDSIQRPVEIKKINMKEYVWKEVQMIVTPVKKVDMNSGFSFSFNDIHPFDGKVPLKHPTNVFRDYDVYETREDVKVAARKSKIFCQNTAVHVIGTIKADAGKDLTSSRESRENLVLFVDTILKEPQPCIVD